MNRFMFTIILVGASLPGTVAAQEQTTPPAAVTFQVTELKKDDRGVGVSARVEGSRLEGNADLRVDGASAKQLIEMVYQTAPLVGIEHLPRDRRFAVSGILDPKALAKIVPRLGELLDLSITYADATTDFLLVRNLTHPIPPSWMVVPGYTPETIRDGLVEVDEVDHVYTANDVTVNRFLHLMMEHTTRPIWNQTSLSGRYDFSFRFAPRDVMRLLNEMGFDVLVARRTTRCVVIAPRPPKK